MRSCRESVFSKNRDCKLVRFRVLLLGIQVHTNSPVVQFRTTGDQCGSLLHGECRGNRDTFDTTARTAPMFRALPPRQIIRALGSRIAYSRQTPFFSASTRRGRDSALNPRTVPGEVTYAAGWATSAGRRAGLGDAGNEPLDQQQRRARHAPCLPGPVQRRTLARPTKSRQKNACRQP